MNTIHPKQLLGQKVIKVYHCECVRNADAFLERRILIMLESGCVFEIDQDDDVIGSTDEASIAVSQKCPDNAIIALSPQTHPELSSPIMGIFMPFGWVHSLGIILESGFVLHNGFSRTENSIMFYRPAASTLREFSLVVGRLT